MKLSSISLFAWIFKLIHKFNPYRMPTLEEKRFQMLNQSKAAVIKLHMTTIELSQRLTCNKKIVEDLIQWRETVDQDPILRSELSVIDQRIKEIELIIFDLECDHDHSYASAHMNKIRFHRIAEQLKDE